MDQESGELTLDDVRAEFPHLICRRGVSGLLYAWPRDGEAGEPLVGKAEDPTDLRDRIIRAQERTEASNSGY